MKLIIDSREHALIDCCKQLITDNNYTEMVDFSQENLHLGDIIVKDDEGKLLLIIERKTIDDLFASIKDGRYKEQSLRFSQAAKGGEIHHHNIVYLLEGTTNTLKDISKKQYYGAVTSLSVKKGFSVWRTASLTETANLLVNMIVKIHKEYSKNKTTYMWYLSTGGDDGGEAPALENTASQVLPPQQQQQQDYCEVINKKKQSNITKDNIGEIMLSQIPCVSANIAMQIMKQYKSIQGLLKALEQNDSCLNKFMLECGDSKQRKISKTAVYNIKRFLLYV